MILYIGGFLIENVSKDIPQTKQVNTIGALDTRQTNYTNTGSFKKTANNVRAMNKLGIVGNNSNIPYQKNSCYLYSDGGECFIYDGWCIISDTGNEYKFNIYDGTLEFYKAIENKTLGDLDLTELNHTKTTSEVVDTFDDTTPYKYILADYNGKALYDTTKINIDYLVPSVKASWLWNKIETFSGFVFNGSFKTNPDFLNLYLTYPKGAPSDYSSTTIFTGGVLTSGQGLTTPDNLVFTVVEPISIDIDVLFTYIGSGPVQSQDFLLILNGIEISILNQRQEEDSFFYYSIVLNVGDVFSLSYDTGNYSGVSYEFKKNNLFLIDFLEELKGFSIRDFFSEIIWRFGLTMFKEKYSNVYNMKTFSEITNVANAIDWSKKFASQENEKYIYGSYAQNNWIRYKYNDENASHNDGFLFVNNKNLEDSTTIIPSKIYSPEMSFSNALGFQTRVYKLWDKEPKDDGETNYKPLANRFYFVRTIEKTFSPDVVIGSQSLVTSMSISSAPIESFTGLSFTEIINKYYLDINKILNKSKIIYAVMFLKDTDVCNIDFSVPYYIDKLGSYFIINKIPNYVSGKPTTIELIRLNNL